jgi:hypothetical protein
LDIRIPANTTAIVDLPDDSAPFEVGSGEWKYAIDVQVPPYPPAPPASLVFPVETPAVDHV